MGVCVQCSGPGAVARSDHSRTLTSPAGVGSTLMWTLESAEVKFTTPNEESQSETTCSECVFVCVYLFLWMYKMFVHLYHACVSVVRHKFSSPFFFISTFSHINCVLTCRQASMLPWSYSLEPSTLIAWLIDKTNPNTKRSHTKHITNMLLCSLLNNWLSVKSYGYWLGGELSRRCSRASWFGSSTSS